jgi:PEGA domain
VKSLAFAVALALSLSPAHADEGRLARAEREMERGHKLMAERDFAGALERFEAAQKLAPESSGPLLAIGLADRALGRCDRAIVALEEYLRKKGDSPSPQAQPALEACRAAVPPPETPPLPTVEPRGSLHIESLPIGAEVRVDEAADEPAGRTPVDLVLPVGRHQIFVSRDGYRTGSFQADVNAGTVTRINATLEFMPPPAPLAPPPAPISAARGKMELFVGPAPVSVLLNGARMPGSGPTFGAELPGGMYRVVMQKAGHEPEYRDVWVRPGETTTTRFTFGTGTSVARHRAIVAVAVLVPLVVAGVAIGLGVGLTQGSSSSSSGSGKEANFGTYTIP